MNADQNPFPELKFPVIDVIGIAKSIGRGALSLVSMHQLASHGDHFNKVDETLLQEPTDGEAYIQDSLWSTQNQ